MSAPTQIISEFNRDAECMYCIDLEGNVRRPPMQPPGFNPYGYEWYIPLCDEIPTVVATHRVQNAQTGDNFILKVMVDPDSRFDENTIVSHYLGTPCFGTVLLVCLHDPPAGFYDGRTLCYQTDPVDDDFDIIDGRFVDASHIFSAIASASDVTMAEDIAKYARMSLMQRVHKLLSLFRLRD